MPTDDFRPLPEDDIAAALTALQDGQGLSRSAAVDVAASALHYAAENALLVSAESKRAIARANMAAFRERLKQEAAERGISLAQLKRERAAAGGKGE